MTTHLKPTGSYPGVCTLESDIKLVKSDKKKRFYIRYRINGIAFKEMVGTSDEGMNAFIASLIRAERIESDKRLDSASNEPSRKKRLEQTFDSLFECYLQFKSIKAAYQDQARYRKHIKPIFGKRTPESITFQEFHLLRNRISEGRKPATIRNILELIRRISNFGKKHGLSMGLSFPVEMPNVFNHKTEDLSVMNSTGLY